MCAIDSLICVFVILKKYIYFFIYLFSVFVCVIHLSSLLCVGPEGLCSVRKSKVNAGQRKPTLGESTAQTHSSKREKTLIVCYSVHIFSLSPHSTFLPLSLSTSLPLSFSL